MPTFTAAEPVVTAHAWSALIWLMSERTGSVVGGAAWAGLFGSAGL